MTSQSFSTFSAGRSAVSIDSKTFKNHISAALCLDMPNCLFWTLDNRDGKYHCAGHQIIFKGWNYNVNLYQASTDASRKPVMLAIATLLITSVVSGAAWNKSEDVTSDSSFRKLEWIKHIFKCRLNIGDKYWAIRSNRVSRAPNWASQIWLSGYLVQISSPGDCLGG